MKFYRNKILGQGDVPCTRIFALSTPSPRFLSFQILSLCFSFYYFVSSSKPKALGELIVYAGSIVRRRPSVVRPILNDYSSETTGPVVTRFHIQPPVPLGVCMGKSELVTVAALGLSWLKKLKKLNEYQRSRSFFDLGQTSHNFRIKTCFPQKRLGYLISNFI